MITEAAKNNFKELTASGKPLVVEFYSDSCIYCKRMLPALEEISNERGDVAVAKCNVMNEPELSDMFGIEALPTMLFFKNGEAVESIVGFVPKSAVEEKLQKIS